MTGDPDKRFFESIREHASENLRSAGPYEIIREIAQGGQGTVYEGIDSRDSSRVAMKRANQQKNGISKLVRGAELASLLDHPFIISLLDIERTDDAVWIITPWVDGVPLDEWCAQSGHDPSKAVSMFFRICDAVVHAHARGVIHRDLRPANILIREDSSPCVLDFGIAKRVDVGGFTHTATQTELSGSILFTAPELLKQDPPAVDIRQDVYALGVLLYTMLTGSHPLDGLGIGECVERVTSGRLFDAGVDRELPHSLGAIIRKATSSDLQARYRTVQELTDDISDDLRGYPIRARVHTHKYLLRRFVYRNRVPIVAGGLLLTGAIVSTAILNGIAKRERSVRAANTQTTLMYADLLESIRPSRAVGPNADGLGVLRYAAERIEAMPIGKSRDELLGRANIHSAIAVSYLHLRRSDLGLPHARKAYQTYLEFFGRDHEQTQEAGAVLVNMLTLLNRMDEAESQMQQLVDDIRPEHLNDPRHLFNMAMLRSGQQRTDEAMLYFSLYFPQTDEGSPERVDAYITRGMTLNRMSRPEDALRDMNEACRVSTEFFGPYHTQTLMARLMRVKSLQLLGRFDEVRSTLTEIMPRVEREFGSNDPRTIQGWAHLCIADTATGFPQRAYDRAREIYLQSLETYPEHHWNIAQAKFLVSNALLQLDRADEVVDLLTPEIEPIEQQMRSRPIAKFQPRYWVARAYNDLGRFHDAYRLLEPVMDELGSGLGEEHQKFIENEFEYIRARDGMKNDPVSAQAKKDFADRSHQAFNENHPFTRRVEAYFSTD